jgi:hypothetical protein
MNIEEILKRFTTKKEFVHKTEYYNKHECVVIYDKGLCGRTNPWGPHIVQKIYHPRYKEYVCHSMEGPALICFNGRAEWWLMGQRFETEEDYWMRRLFYGKRKKSNLS